MKRWYYGYSWNGKEFCFNPFSILILFDKNKFENHWFKSEASSFLLNLVKVRNYNLSALENLTVKSDLFDKFNIENISIIALLFQTGYLTVKKMNKSLQGTTYTLDYPNLEVRKSLFAHIISEYSGANNKEEPILINQLRKDLINKDFDKFIATLKSLFAGLVYETKVNNEEFYSGLMYMILSLCKIYGHFELMTNEGRLDCAIEYEKMSM